MTRATSWSGVWVATIGHSTRSLEELVSLLRGVGVGVDVVADVRTVPRSRHNPQFNVDSLPTALSSFGLGYAHVPRLGGLRRARPDSRNRAWRNDSFRGYADHMLTDEFEAGLDELRALAEHGRTALMCAEAVPWRCHRSLIADVLTARGADVVHIVGPSRPMAHAIRPFARVQGGRVTYPGDDEAGVRLP